MKYSMFLGALLFESLQPLALALNQTSSSIRALYLFKDVMKSDTESIKTSGFNTAVIFGVGVVEAGDIMYYSNTPGSSDILAASDGVYVGGDDLAAKVQSFKTGNTDINRVEISMNSQNILALMASPGPRSSTRLYRNFVALKEAWGLDAVNNDDESIYDLRSTVQFAQMLGQIGYKYTIAPYENEAYWKEVVQEANAQLSDASLLLDRVYLQCYDGGAGNNPTSWANFIEQDVVPLLWVTNESKPQFGMTPTQAEAKFTGWEAAGGLAGGGYWNDFDIEQNMLSYTEYGDVLAGIFPQQLF